MENLNATYSMKIYIVTVTTGNWGEYHTTNYKAFKDPLEAEKEKDFLNKNYAESPPFPFEGETEEEFWVRWDEEGVTKQEEEIYTQWEIEDFDCKEFCSAHVKEMELL